MAVAGLRRIAMVYDLSNGDQAVNTFHTVERVPTAFDLTEAGLIAGQFSAFWGDLKGKISNNVSLNKIVVADASTILGTGLWYEFPVGEAGTVVADPLPFQVALVASLRTAVNTRRGRGRVYLCGFTETANTTSGEPVSTLRADLLTYFTDLMTGLDTIDHDLVVYSRTGGNTAIVTNVLIDGYWDTQRRRANRR